MVLPSNGAAVSRRPETTVTKPELRFKTIFLSVIWLATVCGAVILAIMRRDQYGTLSYVAVGAGVVMLVVFAVEYLPRRIQRRLLAELLGHLSVGLLILFAIVILAASLVKGYRNFGVLGSGVLLLFLITFIRIFISYMKDFKKQPRTRKGKRVTENEEDRAG